MNNENDYEDRQRSPGNYVSWAEDKQPICELEVREHVNDLISWRLGAIRIKESKGRMTIALTDVGSGEFLV
jgi:hypothetical protein